MEDIYGNDVPDGFIIFLDIDGPLVPDGCHEFRPAAVIALNEIIKYYDATLCMLSAWNSTFQRKPEPYAEFLRSNGLEFNFLFVGNSNNRPEYVLNLINKGLTHYLIIDDEAHQYYSLMGIIPYNRILQPNRRRCLDTHDAWYVTKNFKLNV